MSDQTSNSNTADDEGNNHAVNKTLNRQTLQQKIIPVGDIKLWKEQDTKYILRDIITQENGKVDEKITINRHASDQVTWSLVFLSNIKQKLPTHSPSNECKLAAVKWMKDFRSKMVKVVMERARVVYLHAAMNPIEKYDNMCEGQSEIRSFKSLQLALEGAVSEQVRHMMYNFH